MYEKLFLNGFGLLFALSQTLLNETLSVISFPFFFSENRINRIATKQFKHRMYNV